MPSARLVIDASLPNRLATELKRRGRRNAVALSQLGLRKELDEPLLRALSERFKDEDWVLVTGDDNMPAVHADVVAEVGATIATIDPRRPPEFADEEDAWARETVHRWAHVMEVQPPGTIRRYRERSHRPWTPRHRP